MEILIPGIVRCNGLPVTVCDLSGGQNQGTIYINRLYQLEKNDDFKIILPKQEQKTKQLK